jgi:hypothetical protein
VVNSGSNMPQAFEALGADIGTLCRHRTSLVSMAHGLNYRTARGRSLPVR